MHPLDFIRANAAAGDQLGFRPVLELMGPIDTAVPAELRADALAVLREALSNVVRHAGATSVKVVVSVLAGMLTVTVIDNGAGIPADVKRSGLDNLSGRAARCGGSFEVQRHSPSGTELQWSVPL